MDRGQRIALATGGGLVLVGAGGLFWKWWSSRELPPPQPFAPPYGWQPGFKLPMDPNAIYAALTQSGQWVTDLGGGWLLLDATPVRDPKLNPDADAHTGMLASLILSNKGAAPMVFTAEIIGISGDDYNGKWRTKPPQGGPQMIDFRGANIFTLRKA